MRSLPLVRAQLSIGTFAALLSQSDPWRQSDPSWLPQRRLPPLFEAALTGLSLAARVVDERRRPTAAGAAEGGGGCSGRTVVAEASATALVNVYNIEKDGWEPFLEPWGVRVRRIAG